MTQLVGSAEAARRLGVQRTTLYAYVSRGLLNRRLSADGRTSLYAVDELDGLAGRGRRPPHEPRPSIDVHVVTAVSTLDEDGVRYRGRDVAELARTCTFEQVAELLWTGQVPAIAEWPAAERADVRLARSIARVVGPAPLPSMAALAIALGARHGGDDPPAAARRLLGATPALFGGPSVVDRSVAGRLAERLVACWQGDQAADNVALADAVDGALVLLADHELATSTLAVRVAGSTGTGAAAAYAAGLAVLQGAFHGGASRQVHELLVQCEHEDADVVIGRRLAARQRIPGFGHRIYRGRDPRLRPLLDVIERLPDPSGRRDVVDAVLVEAGIRLTHLPNVDFGLGALSFVGGLPADVPLFAVARIAGFAAHLTEELAERPLRYRGLARRA